MNVEYKVSFAPGREPVTILIIPPAGSLVSMFQIEDRMQADLQALVPADAPEGQVWGDEEARQAAQAWIDEHYPAAGLTVVSAPPPPPPPTPEEGANGPA
jgi:hypothetical protein